MATTCGDPGYHHHFLPHPVNGLQDRESKASVYNKGTKAIVSLV